MAEVVSVKFKSRGKIYYFDPAGLQIDGSCPVIVETAKGLEMGDCVIGNHEVPEEQVVPPLRPVIRVATEGDLRIAELNKDREKDAFEICKQKILEHKLEMKLVDVEYNFEGNKILFFFTSDGRVDFRDLVKDLASVFRTRIELRQIGVRDEAKMLGGIAICGRPFCCHQFLDDFQPVSTKMAKTQSMSLNPTKISGNCGRLMCCLRYEQEAYEDLVKKVPKTGTFVETPVGYGSVTQVSLLRQKVKVRIDSSGAEDQMKSYEIDEIAVVPGGRPKPGEPMPESTLVIKPKEEEEAAPAFTWESPSFGIDDAEEAPKPNNNVRKRSRNTRGKGKARPAADEKAQAQQPAQKSEKPQQRNRPGQKKPRVEQKPKPEGQAETEIQKKPKPRRRYSRRPKKNGEGGSAKTE